MRSRFAIQSATHRYKGEGKKGTPFVAIEHDADISRPVDHRVDYGRGDGKRDHVPSIKILLPHPHLL